MLQRHHSCNVSTLHLYAVIFPHHFVCYDVSTPPLFAKCFCFCHDLPPIHQLDTLINFRHAIHIQLIYILQYNSYPYSFYLSICLSFSLSIYYAIYIQLIYIQKKFKLFIYLFQKFIYLSKSLSVVFLQDFLEPKKL